MLKIDFVSFLITKIYVKVYTDRFFGQDKKGAP